MIWPEVVIEPVSPERAIAVVNHKVAVVLQHCADTTSSSDDLLALLERSVCVHDVQSTWCRRWSVCKHASVIENPEVFGSNGNAVATISRNTLRRTLTNTQNRGRRGWRWRWREFSGFRAPGCLIPIVIEHQVTVVLHDETICVFAICPSGPQRHRGPVQVAHKISVALKHEMVWTKVIIDSVGPERMIAVIDHKVAVVLQHRSEAPRS